MSKRHVLRALAIIATSPVWLFVGAGLIIVGTPILIVRLFVATLAYAVDGEWDW
jgi:hypothetical protein